MRRFVGAMVLALSTLVLSSLVYSQQAGNSVPNLIRYSGTLRDAQGAALTSATPMGVTFAIYKQQEGGAAVWQETQNVTLDSNGQYSVLLGNTTATGLPDDLFSQQEQRWLGVQVQGREEQARVMLVSVPYAFKAHEADTLGGLPASAFVKAEGTDASSDSTTVNALSSVGNGTAASAGKKGSAGKTAPVPANAGPCIPATLNPQVLYIPVFSQVNAVGATICDSVIYQTPLINGNVGIGTTTPIAKLDVLGSINDSVGYQISGNNVLLINRSLNNLIVGGNSPDINGGEFNIFAGIDAGFMDTSGYANSFLGAQAGYANTTGIANVFVGTQTGSRNIGGSFGTFLGTSAGLNSNADFNTFVGEDSGFLTTSGNNNTFLGAESGNSNLIGSFNTFTGRQAGFNSTSNHSSYYGYKAGYSNTADGNSFFGDQAGYSNTTQGGNVFFGFQAGYNSTIDNLGGSGFLNGNTFVGYQAGFSNTIDAANSFFGYQAGYNSNPQALEGHVTGNTFAGWQAGYQNTTGAGNTFVGFNAGGGNQTGDDNSYFGGDAGLNSRGNENTFIGGGAGENQFGGGDSNTYLGSGAGGSLRLGDNNIFLGASAGGNNGGTTGSSDDIYIGNLGCSTLSCPDESHIIRIGNDDHTIRPYQTDTYIAGIYNGAPGGTNREVCIDMTGKLWGTTGTCNTSSRRFKEEISDMGDSSGRLFQLRPVSFFYKSQYDDGSHQVQYGLIAEEVAKVYPEMVAYGKDGIPYGVKYQLLAPMLLNELQKEHKVVMAQQAELRNARQEIETLKLELQRQNAATQERLAKLESYVERQTKVAAEVTTAAANGDGR